jgi:hypothetical protein
LKSGARKPKLSRSTEQHVTRRLHTLLTEKRVRSVFCFGYKHEDTWHVSAYIDYEEDESETETEESDGYSTDTEMKYSCYAFKRKTINLHSLQKNIGKLLGVLTVS